jgi:hypothetical protein
LLKGFPGCCDIFRGVCGFTPHDIGSADCREILGSHPNREREFDLWRIPGTFGFRPCLLRGSSSGGLRQWQRYARQKEVHRFSSDRVNGAYLDLVLPGGLDRYRLRSGLEGIHQSGGAIAGQSQFQINWLFGSNYASFPNANSEFITGPISRREYGFEGLAGIEG